MRGNTEALPASNVFYEVTMFGMGPIEIIYSFGIALLMLGFWVGVIVVVVRLALAPLTQKLDRIVALLEAASRRPSA